jgi:hypothetical protein
MTNPTMSDALLKASIVASDYPELPKGCTDAHYGGAAWEDECGRKIAHFTLDAAFGAAERLKAEQTHTNPLQVYLCRFCDWYHIGHRRSAGRRKVVCGASFSV